MTTAHNKEITLNITDGPDRTHLFSAMMSAFEESATNTITFTGSSPSGKIPLVMKAKIIGLTHEDGSGYSFIINANIMVSIGGNSGGRMWDYATFYYNTRTKCGVIELEA